MNKNIINCVYIIIAIGSYTLEHFGIIPSGVSNLLIGTTFGHSLASGSLSFTNQTDNVVSTVKDSSTPSRG